jgi:hypothetical protein
VFASRSLNDVTEGVQIEGMTETITAGDVDNLVLGDGGKIDYTRADRETGVGADTNPADLDLVASTSTGQMACSTHPTFQRIIRV